MISNRRLLLWTLLAGANMATAFVVLSPLAALPTGVPGWPVCSSGWR